MADSVEDTSTRDFAVVGIHQGNVVLEANEWDFAISGHRVVTLYLDRDHALWLADQLTACAAAMGSQNGPEN